MKNITIFFLLTIIGTLLIKPNNLIFSFEKKQIITVSKEVTPERKIEENDLKSSYKIQIYYPFTAYPKLNKRIEQYLTETSANFKEVIPNENNKLYSLTAHYEKYTFSTIFSYVFYFTMDTAGAHPNHWIWTISYDTNTNDWITIDTLLQYNPNILSILSKESRNILKKNSVFQNMDNTILEMFQNGTDKNKENFRLFAFTKDGLLTFFPRYQIAPYAYGEFQVLISYDKIKKSI